MTYEKPWVDEYARLLKDICAMLGGKIVEIKYDPSTMKGRERAYVAEPSYYVYPIFHCDVNAVPMQVEISPLALAGQTSFPDAGYVEYLVVGSRSQTPGNFRIRPEGIFDRVRKALKVHWEFETKDKKFDRLFNLELPDDRAKPSLVREEVKEAIVALLPFEYLQAHPGGLRCSELLSDANQLDCNHVVEQVKLLSRLAILLQQDRP